MNDFVSFFLLLWHCYFVQAIQTVVDLKQIFTVTLAITFFLLVFTITMVGIDNWAITMVDNDF